MLLKCKEDNEVERIKNYQNSFRAKSIHKPRIQRKTMDKYVCFCCMCYLTCNFSLWQAIKKRKEGTEPLVEGGHLWHNCSMGFLPLSVLHALLASSLSVRNVASPCDM